MPDGSLLATVGLYWSGEPLVPTPDGLYHRMSVVAIRSADGASSWQYVGTVANASQYPTSAFGPDENVRHLVILRWLARS